MLLLDFVLGLFKFFCTDVFNFHVVRFIDTAISSGFRGWCRITGAFPRLGAWGLCCESAPARSPASVVSAFMLQIPIDLDKRLT